MTIGEELSIIGDFYRKNVGFENIISEEGMSRNGTNYDSIFSCVDEISKKIAMAKIHIVCAYS